MLVFSSALIGCNDTGNGTDESKDSAAASMDSVNTPSIKEETVSIAADTTNMNCFVAYDENKQGTRPVVLIVPEWWGLNDYIRGRARQLAELGYLALAVDMYGNGTMAANPDQAMKYATTFYKNPQLAQGRMQAALAKAVSYPQADSSKTAAIGYCFGGSMVLNASKMGMPLDGVVSFHGGLAGVTPKKNTIKGKILVCHGLADKFVPEQDVANFKKQLDSVNADYKFKEYPDATHAFTNPDATATGQKFNIPIAYNAEADKNSWNDMKSFFDDIW